MSGATDFWIRWRVRAGYPVGIAALWLARPQPVWLAGGVGIALLGLLLRAVAAGHLRKHERLATSGPYAYTRNPLYLGSALLAAGFSVASRSWLSAVLVAGYLAVFYPAVIRREQAELRQLYGAAFTEYAARVPVFWPRLMAAASSRESFSWTLYRRNREYRAAIGLALATGLLYFEMWWRR